MKLFLLAVTIAVLGVGCEEKKNTPSPTGPGTTTDYTYTIQNAFPSLSFVQAVDIQSPDDGTNRLFVVERRGVIRVFANNAATATTTMFLDISRATRGDALGVRTTGSEEGLLGLAFAPDFATSGYFYVYYSRGLLRETVISRFQVSADPGVADVGSEVDVLTYNQTYTNHNGGALFFGNDGYLYASIGDGGQGGDPDDEGQDRGTILGSIIRIDVATLPYTIPDGNPFKGNASNYAEEIFAWGLRNPWRVTNDVATGDIWAGDVGQGTYEEVNLIEAGNNYGWDCREGFVAFPGPGTSSSMCPVTAPFTDPIVVYGRTEGASITGGYVYRGSAMPGLVAKYIFADFATGRIWSLDYDGTNADRDLLLDTAAQVSTFGLDADGELLFSDYDAGSAQPRNLYRLVETEIAP